MAEGLFGEIAKTAHGLSSAQMARDGASVKDDAVLRFDALRRMGIIAPGVRCRMLDEA